jgi:hypothetical protein
LIRQSYLNLQRTAHLHNFLYISLFQQTLKPKHHYLVHYCRIISLLDPLKLLWCMRYESKHRDITLDCQAINSRVNIAYSVSIKACFKFAYSQLHAPEFIFDFAKIQDKEYFAELQANLNFNSPIQSIKSVIYHGPWTNFSVSFTTK